MAVCIVASLLIINFHFVPDISIVDNLERATIFLFVSILTSTMFEYRKRTSEKLRFLKEFSERVVDSIGDALLVIDPNDYTIISANETALRQLKSRREDLIGKTCYETTHHRSTPCKPPHHICPIQEMLKTGKVVTVEHTL